MTYPNPTSRDAVKQRQAEELYAQNEEAVNGTLADIERLEKRGIEPTPSQRMAVGYASQLKAKATGQQ